VSIDEAKKARWREVFVLDFMWNEGSGVEQLEVEWTQTFLHETTPMEASSGH